MNEETKEIELNFDGWYAVIYINGCCFGVFSTLATAQDFIDKVMSNKQNFQIRPIKRKTDFNQVNESLKMLGLA